MHLEEKIKTAEDRIKELQFLINEWKKAINDKRSQ